MGAAQQMLLAGITPLSVTTSPTTIAASGSASTITSGNCVATAVGGTPPYSYAWVLTAQTGNKTVVAVSPASGTTAFRITTATVVADEGICNATVTATDSSLATANALAVPVDILRT